MSRVESRTAAFEALYAAETAGGNDPDLEGLPKRARDLAGGAWERRDELDAELSRASTGWRVDRMPAVDRSILRLGLYELRHTDTPVAVVISEAVELAKRYSTSKSGSFVNGVLGALVEGRA